MDGIPLQYDALHDELLTCNKAWFTTIKIGKPTIRSFRISHWGEDWLFEQHDLEGQGKGKYFMRVLQKGEVGLLGLYTVGLETVSPYVNNGGTLKNQEYVYCEPIGFRPCRLARKALLRYIG